jgi:hypothetical protein
VTKESLRDWVPAFAKTTTPALVQVAEDFKGFVMTLAYLLLRLVDL